MTPQGAGNTSNYTHLHVGKAPARCQNVLLCVYLSSFSLLPDTSTHQEPYIPTLCEGVGKGAMR